MYLLRVLIGSTDCLRLIGQSNYFGFGFTTPNESRSNELKPYLLLRSFLEVQPADDPLIDALEVAWHNQTVCHIQNTELQAFAA